MPNDAVETMMQDKRRAACRKMERYTDNSGLRLDYEIVSFWAAALNVPTKDRTIDHKEPLKGFLRSVWLFKVCIKLFIDVSINRLVGSEWPNKQMSLEDETFWSSTTNMNKKKKKDLFWKDLRCCEPG